MSPPPLEIVCARSDARTAGWFREAIAAVVVDPMALDRFWSGAGRRLGRQLVAFTAEERRALGVSGDVWGLDELGRTVMLQAALAGLPETGHLPCVERLYRTGELREQQAVVKALPHLPGAGRFVVLGVESVRSNALSLLEAIACENPFPARWFPDVAFNQMIMKALFNGLSMSRVVELEGRRNPELLRMVTAWISERRAAGRAIPPDAHQIVEGAADASV